MDTNIVTSSDEILQIRANVEMLESELAVDLDAGKEGMDALVFSALERARLHLDRALEALAHAHTYQVKVKQGKKKK